MPTVRDTPRPGVATEGAQRAPGRPRSARADQAIVDATLTMLSEEGYRSLSMEAVAARAGVGKATLYRRWSSKEQLVVDAIAQVQETPVPLRGKSVRDDLVVLVDAVRRKGQHTLAGRILPRLISEAQDFPELMRRYREQVIAPRRA